MHTQRLTAKTFKMRHQPAQASYARGCISELSYQGQNPALLNMLLFPLLKQLGEQSRWQLWLTPAHKLSRDWLQQAGLPLEKSVQVASTERINSVSAMIKALRSGNFSVVIAWLPVGLNDSERHELEQAAIEGHTLGLIMREENTFDSPGRQENRLKIHSPLLHKSYLRLFL